MRKERVLFDYLPTLKGRRKSAWSAAMLPTTGAPFVVAAMRPLVRGLAQINLWEVPWTDGPEGPGLRYHWNGYAAIQNAPTPPGPSTGAGPVIHYCVLGKMSLLHARVSRRR